MNGLGTSFGNLLLIVAFAGVVFGGCGVCGVIWFTDHVKVDVQWRE